MFFFFPNRDSVGAKIQIQDDGKGGLSLRGIAFMTETGGFDGFGGSG